MGFDLTKDHLARQERADANTKIIIRGRAGAEHEIAVDEPAFADRHARLEPHPDGAVLRDLGSVDGSVVNGQRVRHAGHHRRTAAQGGAHDDLR